ncbi:hypothetical protein ABPG72_021093 [Tetrahymena utriculariae]
MQNILSIIQDLQKSSQFLQIKKIKEKYFLGSVDDTILKYQDEWKTESIYQDIDQGQIIKNEIEITPLFMDFNKYFMGLIQKLIRQDQTLKLLLTNLLRIQQKSIFDQNIEYKCKSEIDKFNKTLEETKLQGNYPQCYQISDSLQTIINNYQNLIYQLIEYENVQILFKNPLYLDFSKYQYIQFETFTLGQTFEYRDSKTLLLDQKQNYFDTKVKWLLEYEKYSIFVNYLRLEIGIQSSTEYCERDDRIEKNVSLPEIQANYISLFVDVDGSFVRQIVVNFAFSKELKIQQRSKIVVKLNANYIGKVFFCSFKTLKQIPSILNNASCFINSPLDEKKDAIELFLEDQYILMISVVAKKNIKAILVNSISQVLSDILID